MNGQFPGCSFILAWHEHALAVGEDRDYVDGVTWLEGQLLLDLLTWAVFTCLQLALLIRHVVMIQSGHDE